MQAGSKSGALNTADWGADLGKDVWAIPGEISDPLRQGTNCLIQQGAGLAADPGDVLLGLADVLDGSRAAGGDALRRLYRMGASPDQISAQLNLPITTVLARITELELAGEAEGHPLHKLSKSNIMISIQAGWGRTASLPLPARGGVPLGKSLVIVESPAKARTIARFLGRSYVVKASVGHVRDLPRSQFGIDVENNFEPKYITIRGKVQSSRNCGRRKKADCILVATDPDREGEAIAWHLAHILKVHEDKCRIEFREITKDAVKQSIKSPGPSARIWWMHSRPAGSLTASSDTS